MISWVQVAVAVAAVVFIIPACGSPRPAVAVERQLVAQLTAPSSFTLSEPVAFQGSIFVGANGKLYCSGGSGGGCSASTGGSWPGSALVIMAVIGALRRRRVKEVRRWRWLSAVAGVLVVGCGGGPVSHVGPGDDAGAPPADAGVPPSDGGNDGGVAAPSCARLGLPSVPLLQLPNPFAIAVADLDGDGRPDLVSTDRAENTVIVSLGNGNGTFKPGARYPVGAGPEAVVIQDLDHDHLLDLVVLNTAGTVSVLLGDGHGAFSDQHVFTVGRQPTALAVADVNGDGDLDLVVSDLNINVVNVILGAGDGSFQGIAQYGTEDEPSAVAVADVNLDGIPDLLVTNATTDSVSVLLGSGGGVFQPQQAYVTSPRPTSIAVADLNGDGNPDIITNGSGLTVLLGRGDGRTFKTLHTFIAAAELFATAVTDVTGDGIPDVLTSSPFDNSMLVLPGNGDGTFQDPELFAAGGRPQAFAMADIDGDGNPDVLAASSDSDSVAVLFGNGHGQFPFVTGPHIPGAHAPAPGPPATTPLPLASGSGVLADVNGDGVLDLLTLGEQVHTQAGLFTVSLGLGGGQFAPGVDTLTGGGLPQSIMALDVNGDHRVDVVVVTSQVVSVFLGDGSGGFSHGDNDTLASFVSSIAAGDVDGDGHVDLVAARDTTASLLLGNGDGTFRVGDEIGLGLPLRSIALADVNGDRTLDVVGIADAGKAVVAVVLGNGDGTFQDHNNEYATGMNPFSILMADLNGDHQSDAIVTNANDGTVSVLLGNRDGTLEAKQDYAVGNGPDAAMVADLNGDGVADLIVLSDCFLGPGAACGAAVNVLFGNGDGTFQPRIEYVAGRSPLSMLAVTDLDGDGVPDVLMSGHSDLEVLHPTCLP